MTAKRILLLTFLCVLVVALLFTAASGATQAPTAHAKLRCDKGVLDARITVELRTDPSSFPPLASANLACGESFSDFHDRSKIVSPEPFGSVFWNWSLTTDAGSRLCFGTGGVPPVTASCQVNDTGPAITVTVK